MQSMCRQDHVTSSCGPTRPTSRSAALLPSFVKFSLSQCSLLRFLHLLRRWWRTPAPWSVVALRASGKLLPPHRTSPPRRSNRFAEVLPLVLLLLTVIGSATSAPSVSDVALLTTQGDQPGEALLPDADPLTLANTHLIRDVATGKLQRELWQLVAPAAAAVVSRRGVAILLWWSAALILKRVTGRFPGLTLGADAADTPTKHGTAAAVTGRAAGQPPEELAACSPTGGGKLAGPDSQRREEEEKLRHCRAATTSTDSLCPMSDIARVTVSQDVKKQLRHGTEAQQVRAVQLLSQAHVTSWKDVPLHSIHVERLPGGLSNRLYVVEVRLQEGEKVPTTVERRATDRPAAPEQPSEREDGGERKGGEKKDHEKVDGEEKDGERAEDAATKAATAEQGSRLIPRKVLFRVFGQPDSMHLFEPEREREFFKRLSGAGVAPQCYAEFPSGRIEGWIWGEALRVQELQSPKIQEMVASALTEFHDVEIGYGRLCCSSQVRCYCRWRQMLPSALFSEPQTTPRVVAHEEIMQWGCVPQALRCTAQQGEPHAGKHKQESAGKQRDRKRQASYLRRQQQTLPTLDAAHTCSRHRLAEDRHSSLPEVCHHHAEPDTQACTCSLCRGRDWALLAEVAVSKMKAAAGRSEAAAEATASARSRCAAVRGSVGDRAEQEQCTSATVSQEPTLRASAEAAQKTVGGGEKKGKVERGKEVESATCEKSYAAATRARQIRASLEACELLNLEKYRKELDFLRQAVQMQILRERASGELERVYGSVQNWLLLSGGSPVLSHNDLQENNIMSTKGRLRLIDFEYASENLRAADLGNFFCEMAIDYVDTQEAPYFTLDQSQFPSLATRRSIIKMYLRTVLLRRLDAEDTRQQVAPRSAQEKEKIISCLINEDVIANFETMTRIFVLASHLLWSFWSVVKAPVPQPADEFDYLEYARQRLELYDRQKEELFLSDGSPRVSLTM